MLPHAVPTCVRREQGRGEPGSPGDSRMGPGERQATAKQSEWSWQGQVHTECAGRRGPRRRRKETRARGDFRAVDRPAPRPGTGTRKEAGCAPCDPETSTRLLGKAKGQGQGGAGQGTGRPRAMHRGEQQGRGATWEDAP